MKTIIIPRGAINEPALQESLLENLGADYIGLSTTPDEVVIYLRAEAASASVLLAQTLVSEHDPDILSEAQQAAENRQIALSLFESQYSAVLSLPAFDNETAAIRELAERIRRLELLIGENYA